MTRNFTVALLISTYNNPEFLRLCLRSVALQRVLPDEILIADDGSRPDTAEVVRSFASGFSVPVRHIWHPDEGFRLAAIRNKAIRAATADYIVQIDGDILLHPEFISDHKRFARLGTFVTGSRHLLSEAETRELLAGGEIEAFCSRPVSRFYPLSLLMQHLRSADGTYVRGCHMAFWRCNLLAVNGYNEDIKGWGREDSELSWRLINLGLKKRFLKFGAVEYHLFHPENSREQDAANIAIMQRARTEGITRIANGIEKP